MLYSVVLEWLDSVTGGNGILCLAVFVGAHLLLSACIVACLCKNSGVYAGGAGLVIGGVEWVSFATGTTVKTAGFVRAIAWISVGTLWLVTVLVIALTRRALHRKKQLFLSAKGNSALLPEQENTYVRARLHTALRAEEDGLAEIRKSVPYENRGLVRLGYARRLLAGVQDAPLSPAERLETESLAQSFARYADRETWSAEELRAVNELFARLLKLAAKYSVEA